MLHTNRPGLRRPSRSSAAQRSRAGPALALLCAAPHTVAPCVPPPCIRVPLLECAPRCASPCGAACAEPCDRFSESRRLTALPRAFSDAAAPSSAAAPVSRSGSPPAPTAGAPPACATRPGSSPPQTHTPTESARIAPPWLSSPTPASRPKLTLKSRVEVCCAQGGPKQTAEVDHFRMPKSNRFQQGLNSALGGVEWPQRDALFSMICERHMLFLEDVLATVFATSTSPHPFSA